jgi:hypothetical protein
MNASRIATSRWALLRGLAMKSKLLSLVAASLLALTMGQGRAATVLLDYYSATGFTAGDLAGQPLHFLLTLNGNTGSESGFSNQAHFSNMDATASLRVGTTDVFSSVLSANVFMAVDEGLNYIESTIAGVHTIFSSPSSQGPVVSSFPPYSSPSLIDQHLLLGVFFPKAFPIYFVNSYIAYNGQVADLSSLGVSEVPLPAALPLFATGLGVLGLLGWCRKRKKAVR